MKTPSPEDRLLDELLREQAHGPDEAFLQQIENAVDAAPATVVKVPVRSRYGRVAIAVGIGLAAGVAFFLHLQSTGAQKGITAKNDAAALKEQSLLQAQQFSEAIRDQEEKVEERRKVLAMIAEMLAKGENIDVLPSLIGKLKYVKDESRAWVLRPGYGVDGRFPMIYEDSFRQTNKSDPTNLIGPGDSFFLTGPMANRFKLLGSKIRWEMNKAINVEYDVTVIRVEDQRLNKKGVVYEFPSPLAEQRKNEFLQFDRTAVFSLETAGMEGTEFKVEENTAFSLPPGGEKKDYLLKSITPAGVVVEIVDGGGTVEISKGEMPSDQALAALVASSAGSPLGEIQVDVTKSGLAAAASDDAAKLTELDEKLRKTSQTEVADSQNIRTVHHKDGSRSVFARSSDAKTLVKRIFSKAGVPVTKVSYGIDSQGRTLKGRIFDGTDIELFKVRYGYQKNSGRLVEVLMYDSRHNSISPDTGKEMPVQKIVYHYDDQGNRGEPIVSNPPQAKYLEAFFGIIVTELDENPFRERIVPAPAEIAPENRR